MASDTTTAELQPSRLRAAARSEGPALVVLWAAEEPSRVGEVALLSKGAWVLGRGGPQDGGEARRACFVRQRPGVNEATAALRSSVVSRRQLRLEVGSALQIENEGRCPLRVGGKRVDRAELHPGDLLEFEDTLLLRFTQRARVLPSGEVAAGNFGAADSGGLVGETPMTWALRERLAFVGRRSVHVLILGPSGAGKELAARAIHASSTRAAGPFVARNAATIPDSLADAELFGTARDYPNRGAPERIGLVGAAEGGTLFLDELGEMPEASQARLLRVLDDGEYHRLGEAQPRRADIRLLGATNRPPESLKHDVRARLKVEVEVPGLHTRLDDVPLLARHLLTLIAEQDEELAARFLSEPASPLNLDLVAALCTHDYSHHVRELEALLWQAIGDARGDRLALTRGVKRRLKVAAPAPPSEEIDAETLKAALESHRSQAEVCSALGLRNRFQLYRLLRRHGLDRK